ncbi:MAG: hypothetical protein K2X27_18795 [Candidatus Obscuribacterales bacterium]|nr:hypothetical protein [Candidatus Obscuribacterales bacterium]
MSDPSPAEKSSGRSAAREMLAALAKASQDMSRKFNEACEHAQRLNNTLETKVDDRLSELNDNAELLVKSQLEGLVTEKDAIMAELMELRQEELKVLHSIGRTLRESLAEKLKEMISGMRAEVSRMLAAFKELLRQTENELLEAVIPLRNSLSEKMPAQLEIVRFEMLKERKVLEELEARHEELLKEAESEYLDRLTEYCAELKNSLEEDGANYFTALNSNVQEIVKEQEERFLLRHKSLADIEEQCKHVIDADLQYLDRLPESFSESCARAAELQVSLHGTMVNNLALVYRTEILSLAKETEDQLMIVRSHVQTVLHNFQDDYAEQAYKLLSKFERSARESLPKPEEAEINSGEDSLSPTLEKKFEEIRETAASMVNREFSRTEASMDKELDQFRVRLNAISENVNNTVERRFSQGRKEIFEIAETSKDEIAGLLEKIDSLELLVDDARDLISALDESNLDF